MKVFIFPPKNTASRAAGNIQADIETLTAGSLEHSKLKRVCKDNLREKANENAPEIPNNARPTQFYIDPSLGFDKDDLDDNISFGNGCSTGSLKLKDGSEVECSFFVVDQSQAGKFNSKIAQLKAKCEE